MIFGIALSLIVVLASAVLLYQYVTRMLADPLDTLRPLSQGRRPNRGWGKQ